MTALLPLPRLVFGAGSLAALGEELDGLGVRRPLLISDRGLERAGAVAAALAQLPPGVALHLDTPENPTTAGADLAFAAYRGGGCDGVVALGGGSVIDTAKFVCALAAGSPERAVDLLGHPERVVPGVAPLIAVPTTAGTEARAPTSPPCTCSRTAWPSAREGRAWCRGSPSAIRTSRAPCRRA